ncbi:MAG TPA: hypothetical protein VF288_10720 [Mycobacteriales bacterium]
MNWPLDGASVCAQRHGGSTPQVRAKARERVEERRAMSILARLDAPPPIDHPILELISLAAETKELRRIATERVSALDEIDVTDKMGVERVRAVVGLLERLIDQCTRQLVDMSKLDLQARGLALTRQMAQDTMAAVSRALERAGLGEHDAEVREHLASELRAIRAQTPTLPPQPRYRH